MSQFSNSWKKFSELDASRSEPKNRDLVFRLGVLSLSLILSLFFLSSILSGSALIPHNDAWSFSLSAEHFHDTGNLKLFGWNQMFLFGQIVPFKVLLGSFLGQNFVAALFAFISIIVVYRISLFYTSPRKALAVVGIFLLVPEYGLLATSFMTDLPATATLLVAIYFWEVHLRSTGQRSHLTLLLYFTFGMWSCSIREQAVAVLVALVVGKVFSTTNPKFETKWYLFYLTLFLLIFLLVETWRRNLPNADSPPISINLEGLLIVPKIYSYFALCCLPLSVNLWIKGMPRRLSIVTVTSSIVLTLLLSLSQRTDGFFPGNYLKTSGSYSEAMSFGTNFVVIPNFMWLLMIIASINSSLVLGYFIWTNRKWRLETPMLVSLISFSTYIGQTILGQQFFSRYLLCIVPFFSIVIIRNFAQSQKFSVVPSAACFAFLLLISLLLTTNAHLRDSARWSLAQSAQKAVLANHIDGGMEWNGYFGGLHNRSITKAKCVLISAKRSKDQPIIEEKKFRTSFLGGISKLYLLKMPEDCPNE